jgi:hypothetical protein
MWSNGLLNKNKKPKLLIEDNMVCYAEFLGIKNELFGIVSELEQREKQAKVDLLEIEEIIIANPDKALERLKQLKRRY